MSDGSTDQLRLVAGRYRLRMPLGVGGMGTVWRAEDELLGREVAVKEVVFPPGLPDEDREVLRERTRREARAAARLDHPSAVTVYDVVEENGSPFLVLEFVDAHTLSEVVREQGPLSVQRTAQVGLALLGALEAAHREGILHRDVKPGNVLLGPPMGTDPGRVVLTDFGIASSAGDASITNTGLLLGSPAYIAPERARGHSPGPASDLWSLGATLFTAVEGRPPYDGGDPMSTVTAVVTGEHEPFVAAGPLAPVLEGLLAREPQDRLDVAATRAALAPIASSPVATSAVASAPGTLPAPRPGSARTAVDARAAAAMSEDTAALEVRELQAAGGGGRTAPPPRPRLARDEPTWSRLGVVEEPARQRRRLPLVLLMLAVIVAASVGVYLLAGDAITNPGAQPSAAASPAPSDPASPRAAGPAPLPDGWTRYTDAADGWSIGVPPGYEQSVRKGKVQFRNDDTRRTLRVDVVSPEGGALASSEALGRSLGGSFQNYDQQSNTEVDYRGWDAADLAFTYFDTTELRVRNRTVVPEGGPAYELYWQTNDSDFVDSRLVLDELLATFSPAG